MHEQSFSLKARIAEHIVLNGGIWYGIGKLYEIGVLNDRSFSALWRRFDGVVMYTEWLLDRDRGSSLKIGDLRFGCSKAEKVK